MEVPIYAVTTIGHGVITSLESIDVTALCGDLILLRNKLWNYFEISNRFWRLRLDFSKNTRRKQTKIGTTIGTLSNNNITDFEKNLQTIF